MSEYINNRENRQKILKELITELYNGKTIEDIKPRFEDLIKDISPNEISEMEQGLIKEGMPVSEIQRLCDVHASIFKGSIAQIHSQKEPEKNAGHPIDSFKNENIELSNHINNKIKPDLDKYIKDRSEENLLDLKKDLDILQKIDVHYVRKENLIFPYLEKHGITAPPKVMWGVHDDIRKLIKAAIKSIEEKNDTIFDKVNEAVVKVTEMIFKEENILFPMALETFDEDEWRKIDDESDEIGYFLIQHEGKRAWEIKGVQDNIPEKDDSIRFDTGVLSAEQIGAIFNTLPVDISFVDKDGLVKYFSQGKERIFPRTKAIIGREVRNCHPPASVHIVEKIIEDFRSGKKDSEDFWINMRGQFVYIRYFAVRNEKKEYIGTLEVTQNIKNIQEIKGEKRLVSD